MPPMPVSILSSINRASVARVVYKVRGGGISSGIFTVTGGGTITSGSSGYSVATFLTSGTVQVNTPATVNYLIVAGGGSGGSRGSSGGGARCSGGGGAGGYISGSVNLVAGTTYTVTVAATTIAPVNTGSSINGYTGGNSNITGGSIGTLIASGGGGGGITGNGIPGASGGGGGSIGTTSGGTATPAGQGNSGGKAYEASTGTSDGGGGGGGTTAGGNASQTGTNSTAYGNGGNGGTGISVSASAPATVVLPGYVGTSYFCGGGGGAMENYYPGTSPGGVAGTGGQGGGGKGLGYIDFTSTLTNYSDGSYHATNNTGGGGGGGIYANGPAYSGGNGGSGIVILTAYVNPWAIPSTVSANGLPNLYYPFWTNTLDYSANTISGVADIIYHGTTPPSYSTAKSYNTKAAGSFYNANASCNAQLKDLLYNTTSGGTGTTICAWFYIPTGAVANMLWTISQDTGVNKDNRVFFYYTGTSLRIGFFGAKVTEPAINTNTWYFIALVNPANTAPKYFLNTAGQTLSFTTITNYSLFNFTSSSSHFLFGDPYVGSNYGGVVGYINNFYYFPRALSDAEVNALYTQ